MSAMHPSADIARQIANIIRFGTVAEVDLSAARCRVATGDLLTDWVDWWALRAGDVIEWSPPSVGEQGILFSPGGDTHGAVFLPGGYSSQFAAPSSSGNERLVRYPDGAVVKYDHAAHALTAVLPSGGTAEISADGGVTINGDLTVNGDTQVNGDVDVSGTATAEVDVFGGGKSLKTHTHIGVSSGTSASGPPA
jgi:phage baseplate assembly protein V